MYAIKKNDLDMIGFKSIFKNRILFKFDELSKLYSEFNHLVSTPIWTPDEDINEDLTFSTFGYRFNKEEFFKKANRTGLKEDWNEADKAYINHLESLEAITTRMEELFSSIQNMANKEAFEFILPWKWFQK